MSGSLDGSYQKLALNKLEVISLLINNFCNLKCKHCYLQAPKFDDYLSHDEWMELLFSVLQKLVPSVICFSGKEVFFNQQSVNILLDAVRLRNELQESFLKKTKIGVITNGTLIHHFKTDLEATHPDYFDISIDGLPEVHNFVRGKNAFEQLEPNLKWLMKRFPGKVWITHTALEANLNTLPEFIKFYHARYGIDKFSIGFYKAMAYTDQNLKLQMNHYHQLVDRILPQLEDISLKKTVEVIMEFDTTESALIEVLATSGWSNPVDPISSVVHEFSNGLSLRINTARIPVGLWRSVRITPEGYWLAAEDLMRVKEYDKTAIANVRDYQYDARRLYEIGIASLQPIHSIDPIENSVMEYPG